MDKQRLTEEIDARTGERRGEEEAQKRMRRELAEQRAEEESIAEERRAKSARKYEAPPGVLRRPQPLSIETFVSASPQHARFAPSATQTSIVSRLAQRTSAS